jgi:hypothetical protein
MNEVRGRGRAAFAAVLLMVGGILNIVYGIAAIGNSSFFVHNTHYVFGSLKTWGWIALILGIGQVVASMSLFAGNAFGRWFGIAFGALVAIDALLEIPAYPLWSLAMFGLSLWIIYGLAIYHEPEPPAAVSGATGTVVEAERTPASPAT